MTSLLQGKNPNLPNIKQNPDYLLYYAQGMVGTAGANIPEEFRAAVVEKLLPLLKGKKDKRLIELRRLTEHTCVRDVLRRNFQRYIDQRSSGMFPNQEVANLALFGVIDGAATMLANGIVETLNGEFVINPETGIVTSVVPERISRNEVCQAAIKRGETLALLPKEEGGRRRRASRRRKTLRKRKPTKRTKTAKGAR